MHALHALKNGVWSGVLSACHELRAGSTQHQAPKQRHRPLRAQPATFCNLSIYLCMKQITLWLTELGWQAHDPVPLLDQIHQKLSQRPHSDQRFFSTLPRGPKKCHPRCSRVPSTTPGGFLCRERSFSIFRVAFSGEHISDNFEHKRLPTGIVHQRWIHLRPETA